MFFSLKLNWADFSKIMFLGHSRSTAPRTYRSETFLPHSSKPADKVGYSALVSEIAIFWLDPAK